MNLTHREVDWALAVLSFAAFVIGTAELIVVGILDLIAESKGVSIGTAGQLVTAYALGIAIGAPIISIATEKFGRRTVLQAALAAYLLGNLLAIVAGSFDLLLVARVITGSLHGLVAGVAAAIAAGIVPPERRGQAIALVIGGITVSTVVGVPVGTLIGQGLGWRAAFVVVIVLGSLALLATFRFVPPVGAQTGSGDATGQNRAAFAPRVLAMLGIAILLYGGQFTAFTFLTPFLNEVTGISGGLVSLYLLAFGVAATAGTLLGGRAADRDANLTLLVSSCVLVAALAFFYLAGSSPVLAAVALLIWGFAGFSAPPALLLRIITLAGAGADQGPTLGISATNAGIAVGSLVGGAVLGAHGAKSTVLVAVLVCAAAVPAVWASRFLSLPSGPEG